MKQKLELKIVQPCGLLRSQGQTWFLINPHPISGNQVNGQQIDSVWQDGTYLFEVVPMIVAGTLETKDGSMNFYSYRRILVSNAFAIEYLADMGKIAVEVLPDIDLEFQEVWHETYAGISN